MLMSGNVTHALNLIMSGNITHALNLIMSGSISHALNLLMSGSILHAYCRVGEKYVRCPGARRALIFPGNRFLF